MTYRTQLKVNIKVWVSKHTVGKTSIHVDLELELSMFRRTTVSSQHPIEIGPKFE